MASTTRVWWVDFVRGIACLSMPIFHFVYHLHSFGFTQIAYNKTPFWKMWQLTGMSTFVLVSGMAFILSTQNGIRWQRLIRRVGKLAILAAIISLVTWFAMPSNFVRFGVLHFFAVTIVLAPMFYRYPVISCISGLAIIGFFQWMGKPGIWPDGWLYITGMMSERPRSMDYVPLIPWLGVFLVGLSLGRFVDAKRTRQPPSKIYQPVIWLGRHSLSFYFIHQAAIYGILFAVQKWFSN